MSDEDRLELILSQARIAKAAMAEFARTNTDHDACNLGHASTALEAILVLADSTVKDKGAST